MKTVIFGLSLFLLGISSRAEELNFRPLFNGKNLDGWVNVNCGPKTWSIDEDGMVVCTGKPTGELRTDRMYQNFVLELEWRHLKPKGNAGVFAWADDITAKGRPFIRGVEIQVLENGYGQGKGHTTHGDIFPIHGAKMKPLNGRGGSRAFPTEDRSKPSPEWNHYRIECRDGNISLAVNGKVVTQGTECTPKKGYICLESEGGVVNYRNVRIAELPETPVDPEDVAIADRGYRCLYNGIDFTGWKTAESWKSKNWTIRHEAEESSSIETEEQFGDVGFVVDFSPGKTFVSSRIQFRGMEIAIDPKNPDLFSKFKKPGRFHRFEGIIRDGKATITLDGEPLPPQSAIQSEPGPIRLSSEGAADWANIYVRKLD